MHIPRFKVIEFMTRNIQFHHHPNGREYPPAHVDMVQVFPHAVCPIPYYLSILWIPIRVEHRPFKFKNASRAMFDQFDFEPETSAAVGKTDLFNVFVTKVTNI